MTAELPSRAECEYLEAPDAPEPDDDADLCGLCGQPGADKIHHPCYWPGEQQPDTLLVHAECEREECERAHRALTPAQRDAHLRGLR